MLRLRLFGGAALDGVAGPLARRAMQRRRLALLSLLAAGRPMGREKIAALLWPDASAPAARARLSDSLWVLRQALGDAALVATADTVRLDLAAVQSDLADFERLVDAGPAEWAAGVYAGPFLDGFFIDDAPEFDRWAADERTRLAAAYGDTLERLATERAWVGDIIGAAQWWRRRAAHDPFDSRVAAECMLALARVGDRAGALALARSHRRLLREEWDIEPDAAVAELAARLRAR